MHVELNDGRIVRRSVDALRTRGSEERSSSENFDFDIPLPEMVSEPVDVSASEACETENQAPQLPVRRLTRTRAPPPYYGYQSRVPET